MAPTVVPDKHFDKDGTICFYKKSAFVVNRCATDWVKDECNSHNDG
jgi:hypothetical protein